MDNAAHLHLLVNHFPIMGAFLSVPLLLFTLFLRKERGLLLASVFLLVVTAAGGWLALDTGEDAMSMLEGQDDKKWFNTYDEATDSVAAHEERAEKAMYVAVPTAVLGLVALVLAHRRPADDPLPRWWIALLLAGSIATSGAMAWTGNAGGVIMHREIRGDSLDSVTKPTPK